MRRIDIAIAAGALLFIGVTQLALVSAEEPRAIWLWCRMLSLCEVPNG